MATPVRARTRAAPVKRRICSAPGASANGARDDDGPVLQGDARDRLGKAEEQDDDQRDVHREGDDSQGSRHGGEDAEGSPHLSDQGRDVVLRDPVTLPHDPGHKQADRPHRKPEEVPHRAAGQVPAGPDGQGEDEEQAAPHDQVLATAGDDRLAVGLEGFVDEIQATLGSHFVVSFHNKLKINTLLKS